MNLTLSAKNIINKLIGVIHHTRNIQNEINGMKLIGGRNLILDSHHSLRVEGAKQGESNLLHFQKINQDVDLSEVRHLTLSSYIQFNDLARNGHQWWRVGVEARLFYTDGTSGWASAWVYAPATGARGAHGKRHYFTFDVPAGKTLRSISYASIGIQYVSSTSAIVVADPKIEIGRVATDWSPAPEDFYNRINAMEEKLNKLID